MAITMYDLAAGDDRIRFSPYCWRIRMALAHKGLDVETVPVRFMEKEKIAFSGQSLVPVIRDGATVVSDSWRIAHYLDDAYPDRRRLFDGKHSRALTNFMRHWSQTQLAPPLMRAVIMDLHDAIAPADRGYFRESREKRFGKALEAHALSVDAAREALAERLVPMRDMLAEQPFLNGYEPAFADYAVFGVFMWVRAVSDAEFLAPDHAVFAWRERMLDLFDGLARRAPRAKG